MTMISMTLMLMFMAVIMIFDGDGNADCGDCDCDGNADGDGDGDGKLAMVMVIMMIMLMMLMVIVTMIVIVLRPFHEGRLFRNSETNYYAACVERAVIPTRPHQCNSSVQPLPLDFTVFDDGGHHHHLTSRESFDFPCLLVHRPAVFPIHSH